MNRMNIFYKTAKPASLFKMIMLVCIFAWIVSCSKVLDKKPLNTYSDAIVWQDESLISSFVTNVYRSMPHGGFGGLPSYLGCFTDEQEVIGDGFDATFNAGNVTPSNIAGTALDYWSPYFSVIGKCNIFLDRIKSSEITDSIKTRLTGEIKVLRAFAYFNLISFYGGVPILDKPMTLEDDLYLPKNSYDECLNFLLKDLDEAVGMLPLTYDAANRGRVARGVAMAIKSRALLYAASPLSNASNDRTKWQKASDAAKAVIDLNLYQLHNNYKALFLQSTMYNTEIIWQRPFNNLVDFELAVEVALYPPGANGRAQTSPLHNVVADYETVNGLLPKDDPAYNPQNPYVNRDPRFYASILYEGVTFKGRPIEVFVPGGLDSDVPPSGTSVPRPSYYLRKFMDEAITDPINTRIGNTPWTFFRYAEILLNYAEAQYFLGNEPVARTYVNMVRSRPGVNMPAVTEGGAALLTRIQNERRIELAFEGHRFFDVRRWKIAPTVLNINAKKMLVQRNATTLQKTYTVIDLLPARAFTDKNYLLPIPQTEIERDKNLVQNPGYN
jgi:hypothetical protein